MASTTRKACRLLALLVPCAAGVPTVRAETAQLDTRLEPVLVRSSDAAASIGADMLSGDRLRSRSAASSDTARLLEDVPGVSTYGAGGISSLPSIRGLADERIRISVDGMDLMSACPNHMNPALSFIDPSKVDTMTVYAGITPVSEGGDSIGGSIQVKSAAPKFASAEDGVLTSARLGLFSRSNGDGRGSSVDVSIANSHLHMRYSESRSESDNYHAAGPFKIAGGSWQSLGQRTLSPTEVASSGYRGSRNRDAGVALTWGSGHLLQLNVAEQRLDYSGFPNQRMDMISSRPDPENPGQYVIDENAPSNVNRSINLRYTGRHEWGGLEAHLFRQQVRHHMDMNQDRFFGMFMPMKSDSTTLGGGLKATLPMGERHLVRAGGDFQNYRLDDWWPPIGTFPGSMCCNDFQNIRDGERDRLSVFAEWEAEWNPQWLTLLGARGSLVHADAGTVQGYSNTNAYAADAARFNRLDRSRNDGHIDLTALTRFLPDARQTYEAGVARKTRSPSLYERYPWSTFPMAALMNNFVGDGNGYIGNPDLKPEVAHTASFSAAWHDPDKEVWDVKVSSYITHVTDYIDARRCPPSFSARCTALNVTTTNAYVILQYVNQRALLHGVDLSASSLLGRIPSLGRFYLSGSASYVDGKNLTTGDKLYHLMPLNAKLALQHRAEGWTNTVELHAVSEKSEVSQVRNEVPTPGYTLLNLRSSISWKFARLDIALENALDKFYLLPLGGAYLGQGNSMTSGGIPWGMVVPGRGRSLNLALTLDF